MSGCQRRAGGAGCMRVSIALALTSEAMHSAGTLRATALPKGGDVGSVFTTPWRAGRSRQTVPTLQRASMSPCKVGAPGVRPPFGCVKPDQTHLA